MKTSQLKRYLSITLGLLALAIICVSYPTAGAADTVSSSTLDFGSTTGAINDFSSLLSGPVAAVIAVLGIVGGAVLFMQGQELSNGLKVIAVVAITIGMLAGATSYFKGASASIIPTSALTAKNDDPLPMAAAASKRNLLTQREHRIAYER